MEARGKAKEKEGKRKSTYTPGRYDPSIQTIGKGQQGTAHDHDRKGVEAGMGKGHGVLPWAPSRWDGRAWGFAMGEPWASHERRHSHEPRTIDIVNSIVTPSLDRVYNVVEIESY